MATSVDALAPAGRILAVDDEPGLVRCYKRTLEACGFHVETAMNGLLASELLETQAFDLVLSDLSMPRMDGLELLRSARSRDADLPFILITANPTVDTAIEALELGAVRYLKKPCESDALRQSVKAAVEAGRAARAKRVAAEAHAPATPSTALTERFDRALAALWMAYQPIVSWETKSVFAYEALVRTREPSVPHPGALLDAAEYLYALERLGRGIRDNVAGALQGGDAWNVFINLHPKDLFDEALYSPDSSLARFAGRIVFEITERESLSNVAEAQKCILGLRRLGYRVAIDDLGAGYAGMSSFAALEPDFVKLDMSLVRGVETNRTAQKVIESLVTLSRNLGAQVIAEGIETTDERDMLLSLGCDLLQGYLFAKPAPYVPAVKW